jgi:hypothetical protein
VARSLPRAITGQLELQVVPDVKDLNGVNRAMAAFEKRFGGPARELDPHKHVGLIIIDGLSKLEERVMDRLGDLTNVRFVGGSAGDELQFKQTWVYAKGRAHPHAAVLALMKPERPFGIVKTQSFKQTGRHFAITKADEKERIVYELNNEPAAQVYAQAVGCSVEDAPKQFMRHPVGLVSGEDVYVRSPQQIQGGSIVFYCNVLQGMQVSLLEGTDIIADTRKALEAERAKLGGLSGVINFHCILRTLELRSKAQESNYGRLFSGVPTVGFSTYGEQLLGHVNQTSTMLVFG